MAIGTGPDGPVPQQKVMRMHARTSEGGGARVHAKRNVEEVALEWIEENERLTGLAVVRREIRSGGIVLGIEGSDGSRYEATVGMDQSMREFKRL